MLTEKSVRTFTVIIIYPKGGESCGDEHRRGNKFKSHLIARIGRNGNQFDINDKEGVI